MALTERKSQNMDKDFWLTNRERISQLLSNKENEIWYIIDEICEKEESSYTVDYVKKLVDSYVFVSEMIGEKIPYKDIKTFVCHYNPDGEQIYQKLINCKMINAVDFSKQDDFTFLLKHTEGEICREISYVLNDSAEDPHYSAVYTANMIKCLLFVAGNAGFSFLYNDVFGFFISHGFSEKQYREFEMNRKKESEYYRGFQW